VNRIAKDRDREEAAQEQPPRGRAKRSPRQRQAEGE
jgi:hypothetical protein